MATIPLTRSQNDPGFGALTHDNQRSSDGLALTISARSLADISQAGFTQIRSPELEQVIKMSNSKELQRVTSKCRLFKESMEKN